MANASVSQSNPIIKITLSGNPASSSEKRIGVKMSAINIGILARRSACLNVDF